MTILFITKPITLTAGTLAKSGDVNTLFDAVQSNLTTIAGPAISRAFKAPIAEGTTDNIMTQVAAARALRTAYFDSTGNLFASNTALAPFDMGGLALSGVPTPVNPTDAVPFGYLASYSSSLAGIPNVTGKGTSLLTTDGTSPSWTTGTQNIKLGNVTTGTWNAGTVTASGTIQVSQASGYVNIIVQTGSQYTYLANDGTVGLLGTSVGSFFYYSQLNHFFYGGGATSFVAEGFAGATKYVKTTPASGTNNARVSVSSGDLAVGTTFVCDSAGTLGDSNISSVVMYANPGFPSIQMIDGTRSANNRRFEIYSNSGAVVFRWVSDAYSAATNWLVVNGGYATGAISAAFAIPITNTKTIAFTTEFDNGVSGAAKGILLTAAQSQRVTLTANTTLTVNTVPGVGHFHLKLIQDATGSRTVTWAGFNATECPNNVFPAISTVANGVTFLTFYYDGTQLWCKGSQPMD